MGAPTWKTTPSKVTGVSLLAENRRYDSSFRYVLNVTLLTHYKSAARIQVGTEEFHVENAVVCVPRGEVLAGSAGQMIHCDALLVESSAEATLMQQLEMSEHHLHRPWVMDDAAVVEQFKSLRDVVVRQDEVDAQRERIAKFLLSSAGATPASSSRPKVVSAAIADMRANLASSINLATLSERNQISRFHLIRVFKRAMGITPHQYLIHLRVAEATDRLLRGETNLAEIATACGFADHSHLHRHFKKIVGMTPGQYRETKLGGLIPQDF